jgi:hypothetical protein
MQTALLVIIQAFYYYYLDLPSYPDTDNDIYSFRKKFMCISDVKRHVCSLSQFIKLGPLSYLEASGFEKLSQKSEPGFANCEGL